MSKETKSVMQKLIHDPDDPDTHIWRKVAYDKYSKIWGIQCKECGVGTSGFVKQMIATDDMPWINEA